MTSTSSARRLWRAATRITLDSSRRTRKCSIGPGEAFVDAGDFQPIRVFTKLSRRVPFFARNVVGTNLSGFGYELDYRRQDGGIWFPVTYGAEYELRLLFRIHRNISISMAISCHEPA